MYKFVQALLVVTALCQGATAEEAVAADTNTDTVEISSTSAELAPVLPEVLDLATVQARVIAANPTLAAAQQRINQALQRVKQAQSLWYPQLQAEYRASQTERSDASLDAAAGALSGGSGSGTGTGTGGTLSGISSLLSAASGGAGALLDEEIESYTLGFRASYVLFNGFSRRFSNMIAQYGHQESEAMRMELERQLLNAASNSFFRVQLARENVSISNADMEFNERLLSDAQARRKAGLGSLSDELNFEVQIRAAKARLIRAQRDLDNSRVVLAELMGLPDAYLPDNVQVAQLTPETQVLLQTAPLEKYLADADTLRPDLLQRRLAVERSDATVKRERSSWYPQINAFASYDGNRSENSAFDGDDFSTTIGVSVSYDLFTGGRNRAEIAEKKYARAEAGEQLAEMKLRVSSEVRQELLNVHSALEQLTLQSETAGLVSKNRDLVEKEYNAGQASLTRLTQAQRDLIAAEVEFAVARVALRQAWHNLYTVSGRPVQELLDNAQSE